MQISFSDYVPAAGVATELVNSGPEVRRHLGESIPDVAALADLLGRYGIASGGSGGPAVSAVGSPIDRDLRQVYVLRRRVGAILRAEVEVEVVDGANALVATAGVGPLLDRSPDGGEWQWYVGTSPDASLADQLAVLIGVGVLGTIRALGYERLRGCAAPDCDGVFVDTSRAGRRRYCMPELCGNRTNVAHHRARRRSGG